MILHPVEPLLIDRNSKSANQAKLRSLIGLNFNRRKKKNGAAVIRENLIVRHDPLTEQYPVDDYNETKLLSNPMTAGRGSSDIEPKPCNFEEGNGSTAEINKDSSAVSG